MRGRNWFNPCLGFQLDYNFPKLVFAPGETIPLVAMGIKPKILWKLYVLGEWDLKEKRGSTTKCAGRKFRAKEAARDERMELFKLEEQNSWAGV